MICSVPAGNNLNPNEKRAAAVSWRGHAELFFAGQMTGVEGYVESTASGCLAAMELATPSSKAAERLLPLAAVVGLFVVRRTDVVEQFGDLELGGGIGLGGQFLDRLALRLQFSFLGRTGDVQDDGRINLGVQHDADIVQAQFLDRLVQHDLLAVQREARLGGGIGRVTGGDGPIQRAGVGCGTDDHKGLAVQLVGDFLGLCLGFGVLRLQLDLAALERLDVGVRRAQRLALRQQEVAGIAVLDVHDLAHLAQLGHAFQQNDLHRQFLTSRRRAAAPGSARA